MSHLSVEYPIQSFYNIANLCFGFCSVYQTLLPEDELAYFFISVLPALQRICLAYPIFYKNLINLLADLQNICSMKINLFYKNKIANVAIDDKMAKNPFNCLLMAVNKTLTSLIEHTSQMELFPLKHRTLEFKK